MPEQQLSRDEQEFLHSVEMSKKSLPTVLGLATRKGEQGSDARASLMARPMTLGLGAGLLTSYAPLTWRQLRGGGDLYHGTSAPAAADILSSGLLQEHAGRRGRLNARFQSSALVNAVENALGRKLPEQEVINYLDRADDIVDAAKELETPGKLSKEKEWLTRIIDDKKKTLSGLAPTDELTKQYQLAIAGYQSDLDRIDRQFAAARGGVSSALINDAVELAKRNGLADESKLGDLTKELNEAGRRIYFGHSPASVSAWSGTKTEAQMIMDTLAERNAAAAGADTKKRKALLAAKELVRPLASSLIGGLDYTVQRELLDRIRFRLALNKITPQKMPREQAITELQEYAKSMQLKDPAMKGGAILRTAVPGKTPHFLEAPGPRSGSPAAGGAFVHPERSSAG